MRIPLQSSLKKSIPFFTPGQVRQIDARAIERLGDEGGYRLMSRAGKSACELLQQLWPSCRSVRVFCGAGNNAGDGYILARLAHLGGLRVTVVAVSDPGRLRGEAAIAHAHAVDAGVEIRAWAARPADMADVHVDALLGTGLSGDVHGVFREAIETLNATAVPVLSLDVPSGLCAATGCVLGASVQATATLCFIAPKAGLLTGEAVARCGCLWLDDLGCGEDVRASEPLGELFTFASVLPSMKVRPADAHKGQFGRVLVVGGDYGYGGAVILAAASALRAGAGAVTCATRDAHVQPGLSCFPDIMFRSTENRETLLQLLDPCDVVAVGPGLGRSPWGEMCLRTVLDCGRPLVLDADALNLLASNPWSNPRNVPMVITPHPGEAGRLLGSTAAAVNADRFGAARQLAERFRGVCLLKGAGTVIADGGGRQSAEVPSLAVLRGGNPGMATAGMGDVLTGVVAGLLGQGLEAAAASRLGVAWHAATADRCVERTGEASLMASDVMGALGETLLQGRRERSHAR